MVLCLWVMVIFFESIKPGLLVRLLLEGDEVIWEVGDRPDDDDLTVLASIRVVIDLELFANEVDNVRGGGGGVELEGGRGGA